MNWTKRIADCLEHDNQRHLLKGIPLVLIATTDYIPDYIYFTEYIRANTD